MNNLISFPTKKVRSKISFDKAIKIYLSQFFPDLDSNAIKPLMERLYPLWDMYQNQFKTEFSIFIPSSVSKSDADKIKASVYASYNNFLHEIHHMNAGLLIDRANAEIRLYRMETGS